MPNEVGATAFQNSRLLLIASACELLLDLCFISATVILPDTHFLLPASLLRSVVAGTATYFILKGKPWAAWTIVILEGGTAFSFGMGLPIAAARGTADFSLVVWLSVMVSSYAVLAMMAWWGIARAQGAGSGKN